jgi:hemolysin activation/secretion protein
MDSVWLKRGLLALAILLAAGCVAALLLPERQMEPQTQNQQEEFSSQDQGQPQQPQSQMEPQQTAEPEAQHMYEMGIWEGKVAVFLPGTNVPMRITEMPVTSLPTADQQALKDRIPVYDAQELASFLEDYGS